MENLPLIMWNVDAAQPASPFKNCVLYEIMR